MRGRGVGYTKENLEGSEYESQADISGKIQAGRGDSKGKGPDGVGLACWRQEQRK